MFSLSSLESNLRKVSNIFVRIVGHFFKWWDKLVAEDILVDVLSFIINYFRNAEFNIWNIIFSCLKENWDDVLCNLLFHYKWHDGSKRVQAAHSVVVSFFVNGVMVVHDWNVVLHDPVTLEFCSK